MAIEVEPCSSVEAAIAALTPIWHYFSAPLTREVGERFTRILEPGRMVTAKENGRVVGGAGVCTLVLTVPGGSVRAAGTTMVGVLPTHRRRGILRRMMRAHLDDVHARGEPVAILWASEESIYGRFGWGMASLAAEVDLPKSAGAFATPCEIPSEVCLLDPAESPAPLFEIYERVRPDYAGMISRTPDWWQTRRLTDPNSVHPGAPSIHRALLLLDGKPEGYALYRIRQGFEAGATVGRLEVVEAIGASPLATRTLWR